MGRIITFSNKSSKLKCEVKNHAKPLILCLRDMANMAKIFHERGPYHVEASPLICRASQWTDFYMIRASFMKEQVTNNLDENLS